MKTTGLLNGSEVADIASKESSTKPQLVLKIRRCGGVATCDDHVTCSQEGFGFACDDGVCQRLTAPPISPCEDGNPCTVDDHCSGMDYTCVSETPAPEGTPCGEGQACNAEGECI